MIFFWPVIFIVFGSALGSFSTMLAYRIPRTLPVLRSKAGSQDKVEIKPNRSACTKCQIALAPIDLVPVISWAVNKGQCRSCGESVSARYPVTEIICAIAALGTYIVYGISFQSVLLLALIPCLAALILVDLEHMILPNVLVSAVGVLGVFQLFYSMSVFQDFSEMESILTDHIFSFFLYGLFAWGLGLIVSKILKKDALGFGDVKFFAVSGLWLGSAFFSLFIFFSGVLGVILSVLLGKHHKNEFPFGPALVVSLFTLLLLRGYDLPSFSYLGIR